MLTLGSLFDGSGGFPLAGTMNGFEPLWASEVEPYPIAVTRSRFPQMLHLGNVCDVNGATVRPVDVITFGSPCQDLSVAGKRAGLKHEDHGDDETTRSGLFMEAVRIITEMREATNGRYPTFAVWENVPGALSSSGGDDFLAVLKTLQKSQTPKCQYLNLTSGAQTERSSETVSVLLGVSSMRDTLESPSEMEIRLMYSFAGHRSVAEESTLSQILEAHVPEKYFLSAQACRGILNRAQRRGKELPPMLKEALGMQSATA